MVKGWDECCALLFFHLVPAPTVTITSGNITVGSDVILMCTVDLDPAVDVSVTVDTVWSGPDGFMNTTTAQPVMGSTATYTSTARVSSFGRNQSGNYSCEATISPTNMLTTDRNSKSGMAVVTVGKAKSTCTLMRERDTERVLNIIYESVWKVTCREFKYWPMGIEMTSTGIICESAHNDHSTELKQGKCLLNWVFR